MRVAQPRALAPGDRSCNCGGGGGSGGGDDGGIGDYGPGSYGDTSVSEFSGNEPYDMEDDYSDGTSSLWGDYDGNGVDLAVNFAPDQTIAYVQNTAATAPPQQDDGDPDDFIDAWGPYSSGCAVLGNGTLSCPINGATLNFIHSPWFCGVMVGTGAIGTKYGALQMKAGQPWADLAGMIVGVSLAQLCTKK